MAKDDSNSYISIRQNNQGVRLAFALRIEKARIEQSARLDISHRGKECLFEMRIFFFKVAEQIAQRPPHCAGPLRAAAWNDGRTQRLGESRGQVLSHVDQRPDQPEIALARP